ncbi:AMP-dependent synthetase/ligase [Saprospira grandis]|uniref:AMP-dependent synthetase/ligase n=1 Tax=Saprospira grandis TaxID=1008 RepID=UPI0022DD0A7E|nr:long-chain fatty acid--CoA ligase [Saprospira grandis]WBM75905.1 long-chain fatty acid--CoA ligase [Saprospira grandis]
MEIRRLFDIPYYQAAHYPLPKAIGGQHISGKKYYYSTEKVLELINKVSWGLLQMGMKPGDKIALISYNNRPEWNIMDLGMQQIGVINVPVYPTISPDDYVYIFNDSTIKYAVVGHGDLLDKVRTAQSDIPSLQAIFTFDEADAQGQVDANGQEVSFWEHIWGENPNMDIIQAHKDKIKAEDLATIIYTSGTTGKPKGVMLSHNNIATNVRDVLPFIPLQPQDIALSFLPLCHVFERTVTYSYMAKGAQIFYAKDLDTLSETLQDVRPHFFTTVPRLLEKVYEKMMLKVQAEGGLKEKIFNWALGLTEKYDFDWQAAGLEAIKWKIADKLVFSKVRDRLGGRLKGIVTGAAACPPRMTQLFSAVGVPIREGYGLTETSPAISINIFEPYQAMIGSVGPILPSVQVKIDQDDSYGPGEGEVLVKGNSVMMGYYRKEDKTAEVFNEEGWFLTGDIGKIVENKKGIKFLKITDRKKELLKTSGGKYVAPTPIESTLKEDLLVEQVMVVGEKRKFVSALIQPNFESLKNWCQDKNITWTKPEEVLANPKVLAYFQAVVNRYNPRFSKVEQIKKFHLVPTPWGVETGELTPTMKLKRRVILANYEDAIEKLYQ